jgi:hypothetical protein
VVAFAAPAAAEPIDPTGPIAPISPSDAPISPSGAPISSPDDALLPADGEPTTMIVRVNATGLRPGVTQDPPLTFSGKWRCYSNSASNEHALGTWSTPVHGNGVYDIPVTVWVGSECFASIDLPQSWPGYTLSVFAKVTPASVSNEAGVTSVFTAEAVFVPRGASVFVNLATSTSKEFNLAHVRGTVDCEDAVGAWSIPWSTSLINSKFPIATTMSIPEGLTCALSPVMSAEVVIDNRWMRATVTVTGGQGAIVVPASGGTLGDGGTVRFSDFVPIEGAAPPDPDPDVASPAPALDQPAAESAETPPQDSLAATGFTPDGLALFAGFALFGGIVLAGLALTPGSSGRGATSARRRGRL